MIFRNSILSLLRSKGKTALFTLLILALTLALSLGVSVWASVAQFLDDCEEYYTTIGLVEYMGTGYPDDTGFDPAMDSALASFDAAGIAGDDATLSWEVPTRSLGTIDGFWRTDTYMPGRMLSVLVVGNVIYSEEDNIYSAIVMRSLYSVKSEDDTIVLIDGNFGTFEKQHYYLVFGEVYYGPSPLLHLRIASYDNTLAAAGGVEVPRMIDITADGTDGRHFIIPEDSVLLQVAQTLPVTNNSLLVNGTDDLMALLPFHQQELYITAGRPFTQEEYDQGSQVIIISELVAARLGVGVGDTIDLSVAVSDQPGVYNSYWVGSGFNYRQAFTVTGIMNTVLDKSWYVYVPKSAGVPASVFPVGYTVGQAVIRNQDAAGFYDRVGSALKDRFQLTVYDQGYSAVAIPYRMILRVAKIVTFVCVVVELAVLILFGFLFVYRQRETSETMRILGAGRVRVLAYFFYSSGSIALVAAAAGATAGFWLHEGIIALVAKVAGYYVLVDSRYSNGNLTIARMLEFAPQLKAQLFLLVGLAVFLSAILSCLAFTAATFFHSRPSQKKVSGPNREHKTSRLGGGNLKYALLSILRGGARTTVVPALAMAVVIFFGQLAATSLRYQEQLESIHTNTTLDGYYTDINGKQIGNLVLNAYDLGYLYHEGQVSSLSVSRGESYTYLGVPRLADGTQQDVPLLYVPASFFAKESLEESILRGPDLVATNDIRSAPEFYYADTILMTFMDGFDESILAVPAGDERVNSCLLPTSFMEDEGIALGDTIRLAINYIYTNPEDKRRIYVSFDLQVVGSYEKQGTADTVYAPLGIMFDTSLIWDEGQAAAGPPVQTFESGYVIEPRQKFRLQRFVFHSASFTLSDAHLLPDFKDHLAEYGYSQVQDVSTVREFIVLNDSAFNNSVAGVRQQIRYIHTLYPFLYALVGIIAIVASYLLVVSRKNEFATMRGLGARRSHAFWSFFFEQAILCLLGTAMGLAIWYLGWGVPTILHMALTAGFLTCYFIGASVSIIIMNHSNVFTILLDRD